MRPISTRPIDLSKSKLAEDLKAAGATDLIDMLPFVTAPISGSPAISGDYHSRSNRHVSVALKNVAASTFSGAARGNAVEPVIVVSLGLDSNMVPIRGVYSVRTGGRLAMAVSPGGVSGTNAYPLDNKAMNETMDGILATVKSEKESAGLCGNFIARAARTVAQTNYAAGATDPAYNTKIGATASAAMGVISDTLYYKAGKRFLPEYSNL